MAKWLYAASKALASEAETLRLAGESGFIWRSFYNTKEIPIACVKDIKPGDDLFLGYRVNGAVKLLAKFRVGRPDKPIAASPVFGEIPAAWIEGFRRQGYSNDPKLGALVGIFVEDSEPLSGQLAYGNQNSLSRLDPDTVEHPSKVLFTSATRVGIPECPVIEQQAFRSGPEPQSKSTERDGVHVGIDVGGRREKGFYLCTTEWVGGSLNGICWKRVPHATPLPTTASLRALVRDGDLAGVAEVTRSSAITTAAGLWSEIKHLGVAGIHIDAPSAFSRNQFGHGRLCEKVSLVGVSFQSTPSIACGDAHGGDWGWLVYGMIAFAACLHRGQLTGADWMAALECGNYARCGSAGIVLRECFPTATVSTIRAHNRESDVERSLVSYAALPEVQAVFQYLRYGVRCIKPPGDSLYDRADSLVAALGALPHVAKGFREVPNWGVPGRRWNGFAGEEQIEGSFTCVK